MNNPRIIAGTAKNKRLLVPETSRPVTDRIKQSIFDLLGDRVVGAKVLDLYAGSGSFGIETLSRGALSVVFVEQDDEAVGLLRQNLDSTGFASKANVFTQSVQAYLQTEAANFDLIFCDPPFIKAEEFELEKLANFLESDGLIIFRKPTEAKLPSLGNLYEAYSQKYGESEVFFLGKRESA
jgi:16S rRNA (guanine(966)-N(2))-methyltransferase RsmD